MYVLGSGTSGVLSMICYPWYGGYYSFTNSSVLMWNEAKIWIGYWTQLTPIEKCLVIGNDTVQSIHVVGDACAWCSPF